MYCFDGGQCSLLDPSWRKRRSRYCHIMQHPRMMYLLLPRMTETIRQKGHSKDENDVENDGSCSVNL